MDLTLQKFIIHQANTGSFTQTLCADADSSVFNLQLKLRGQQILLPLSS